MKDTKQFIHLLHLASRQFSKSFNDHFAPAGLYAAQWTIIRYLAKNGPSSQVAMSQYLGVEAPTMTRTLSRMENAGFIKRIEGKDRREKIITLTNLTISKIPDWDREISQFENPLFGPLTVSEVETAEKVLQTLILNLKQQDHTGGVKHEERNDMD
ncbi:MarR family transcriptional regulator [Bacillus sp. AGMB 02131]|uniref:MarR family transcriptional regulator n=1 Tax=Peribacillus faecalis TaxID=2772559 RepID=A0A927HBQ4_9BACI|nr:MarR family transcriptional regulator [Peribacillus faecalis]MBD3110000.1 MarR family transcriptional regulator [Peribacillus faecalis]